MQDLTYSNGCMYKRVHLVFAILSPNASTMDYIKLLLHVEMHVYIHTDIDERYNDADTSDRCSVRPSNLERSDRLRGELAE